MRRRLLCAGVLLAGIVAGALERERAIGRRVRALQGLHGMPWPGGPQ